jgi:hypothetical protein
MKRIKGLLVNLAILVMSLVVVTGLIELWARWTEAARVRAVERELREEKPISQFDPLLGWCKYPGGSRRIRRAEFDITIQINSLGLRGPERPYRRPADTRRVLLLGDSFGEGYYVQEEDTVRAVLERGLRDGRCGSWEVINGSTIAYSTDQEYLFFKSEGRKYGAEWVVLLFYYNDLFYNARPQGPAGEVKPFFVVERGQPVLTQNPLPAPEPGATNRQGSGIERVRPWRGSMALRRLSNRTIDGAPRVHGLLARLGLVQPASNSIPRELVVFGPPRPEVEVMWETTAALLKGLRREVEAEGARLAVLYVPVRFEVNDSVWELTKARYGFGRRWDRTRVVVRLREICRELELPFVDPSATLRAAESSGPAAYFTRDVHWTKAGNLAAAQALEETLRARLQCSRGRS